MNVLMRELYRKMFNIPRIPGARFQILDDCYVIITRYYLAKPYKGTIHSVVTDTLSTNTIAEYKYVVSIEGIDPDMILDNGIHYMNGLNYVIRYESDVYKTLEDAQLKCDLINDEIKNERSQSVKELPIPYKK